MSGLQDQLWGKHHHQEYSLKAHFLWCVFAWKIIQPPPKQIKSISFSCGCAGAARPLGSSAAQRHGGGWWYILWHLSVTCFHVLHVWEFAVAPVYTAFLARETSGLYYFIWIVAHIVLKYRQMKNKGHHFTVCLFLWMSHGAGFFHRLLMLPWVVCDMDYHLYVKKFRLNSINACFSLASAHAHLLDTAVTWGYFGSCILPTSAFKEYWSGLVLTHWDNFVTQLFEFSVYI